MNTAHRDLLDPNEPKVGGKRIWASYIFSRKKAAAAAKRCIACICQSFLSFSCCCLCVQVLGRMLCCYFVVSLVTDTGFTGFYKLKDVKKANAVTATVYTDVRGVLLKVALTVIHA